MVKISVITATLNCADVFAGLINSLLAQTDTNFEWVVIDGVSSDQTLQMANNAPLKQKVVLSEPDFGIYHALNKGIALSSGDYYLVVGADDQLSPMAIAEFRRIACLSKPDLVAASVEAFGQILRPGKGRRWHRGGNAFFSSHSVGTLIKKSLHERFGYYSNKYVCAADMYFLLMAVSDQQTHWVVAPFIAGQFSDKGISSIDKLCSLSDAFRIQIRFKENRLVQYALYIYRVGKALLLRG
jgi:glycosyltransferase involved in cell wall biosynthesis